MNYGIDYPPNMPESDRAIYKPSSLIHKAFTGNQIYIYESDKQRISPE